MEESRILSPLDRYRAQVLAKQAAGWFRLFECLRANPPTESLDLDTRLDMLYSLHHMHDFRLYVHSFLHDDTRIASFEDAVAEAVYQLLLVKGLQNETL